MLLSMKRALPPDHHLVRMQCDTSVGDTDRFTPPVFLPSPSAAAVTGGGFPRDAVGMKQEPETPSSLPSPSKVPRLPPESPFSVLSTADNSPSGDPLTPFDSISSGSHPSSPSKKSCAVCGDKATGYHFNALTCEGCKGFFRRNSMKKHELHCSFNRQCEINKYTRRHCQFCRLHKCIQVGMLQECIMTDEQKVMRKIKNMDKKCGGYPQSPAAAAVGMTTPEGAAFPSPSGGLCGPSSPFLDPPNREQFALLEELSIEYHNLYNTKATIEDVIKNVPSRPGNLDGPVTLEEVNDPANISAITTYLSAITTNRMKRCITFCQRMPGFSLLSLNDMMCTLKGAAFEIVLLRSSLFVDSEDGSGSIRAGSFVLTPDILMRLHYLRPFVMPFFQFIGKFRTMHCDLTELLLLIGICLFSPDRPGLEDRTCIGHIQQIYADTLQSYIHCASRGGGGGTSTQPKTPQQSLADLVRSSLHQYAATTTTPEHSCQSPAPTALSRKRATCTRFGKFIMHLCSLRTVSFQHSKSILTIGDRHRKDLKPFLREMFFVKEYETCSSSAHR